MTPERWQRVREVFEAVVDLPPAARGSYFEPDALTESFGISPGGTHVTLTLRERTSHIVMVRGVEGVDP